jgi:hypothetical protein
MREKADGKWKLLREKYKRTYKQIFLLGFLCDTEDILAVF